MVPTTKIDLHIKFQQETGNSRPPIEEGVVDDYNNIVCETPKALLDYIYFLEDKIELNE